MCKQKAPLSRQEAGDGSNGEIFDWANWSGGEPNNVGEVDENVAILIVNSGLPAFERKWQDYPKTGFMHASVYEWSADCNGDGIVDFGQILDGSFADDDGNGVPDCCDDGACLAPVQWRVEDGGNDHWYGLEARGNAGITWESGSQLATSMGGYLATLTSAAESELVWRYLASRRGAWNTSVSGFAGPHVGLQRADGDAPWEWVTGERFEFAEWGDCKDDNAGVEDRVQYGCLAIENVWNDIASDNPNAGGFIIEWSADCNGDGIVDYGQILDGTYADENGNGVPDCCDVNEPCDPCIGDITGNGVVDAADLGILLAVWNTDGKSNPEADINGDGTVNAADLGILLGAWGLCP